MAAPNARADEGTTPGRIGALAEFLTTESGGAIVLLGAAVLALLWANSPFGGTYDDVWATPLSLHLGDWTLAHSLRDWVNEGLMTVFFLVIGLEVRREFDLGEFRERRRVAAPVLAAVGGMCLPVVFFLALNSGSTADGWALVIATDTAFAVGVLALVGSRSSLRLRSFLLTLVIVDDVAAVSVIAIAYTSQVSLDALAAAIALLLAMGFLRWRGVDRSSVYAALALGIWLATAEAGVHPTVAGVAIGLLTPAHPPRREDLERATGMTRLFRQRPSPDLAAQAARRISQSVSPNVRLQHRLHPWSSLMVVPLFALANAGLRLDGPLIASALGSPLVIGIVLGLVVGKTLGIPLGSWLSTRRWLGGSPLVIGWPSLVAASSVGGIGFTMSLLIAELSYAGPELEQAKLGIFVASILAAALSITMFRLIGRLPADLLSRAEARTAEPLSDLALPVDPAIDHVRGPLDAPVTLVEYADFECPHCGRMAPVVREIVDASGGRVRHVFRHLPLTDVHPNAALAAEASEAAAAQGRFWEFHDRLFDHQDDLSRGDLLGHALAVGLDLERFRRELETGKYDERVLRDVESAEESGVAGTPGFFINGVHYRGLLERPSIERALAAAGARASEVRSLPAAEPG